MKRYLLFFMVIQPGIFLYGMEDIEPEEGKKFVSPVSSVMVKAGSTPSSLSRNASVVSEDTSIENIATSVEQLVQISRQNNTLLANFVNLQNEQLALQKKKLQMKKKEIKFNTAAKICSLQASLGMASPHSRIESGLGAWSVIQEKNEQLKVEERKKIKNLDAAIAKEQKKKEKKSKKKETELETARHMKKAPSSLSARSKKSNKKS